METKKYITILDFETAKIYQYEVEPNQQHEERENFIIDMGFNLCNIEWMIHDEPGIVTKFKSDIKEEIKISEQHQEEMEKGNPDNDFSEYQKGYTDGLNFAQGVVDKVFTRK